MSLMGMFPSTCYKAASVILNPGDIAVLFTDGITESRSEKNEEFNEERLVSLVRKHAKLPAQKMLEKIYDEVDLFASGTSQMDDMTLVIIKRKA